MSEPEDPSRRDTPDLDRRSFFRQFGRSAVQAAGQVVGTADALRRGSTEAASELLRLGLGDPEANADRIARSTPTGSVRDARPVGGTPARRVGTASPRDTLARIPGEAATYRSPYRVVDDTLVLVDRRSLPEDLTEMECRFAGEVARAIRAGAVHGGPLLAQLAAYGLALTAGRHRGQPVAPQLAELHEAIAVLRRADPSARAMLGALDRIAARLSRLDDAPSAEVVADVLRSEADAIASDATMDHAALARHGSSLLAGDADAAVRLLLHGPLGPMDSGVVGTGLGVVQALSAAGRALEIWVTEGRPTMDGARVTTWELDQMALRYSVLPDSAVTWLLDHTRLDAVLLGAEWIAADGDAASAMGSGAIAALAGASNDLRVPVYVCAPTASIGLEALDAEAIPRSAAARTVGRGAPARATASTAMAPSLDVVRARNISAIVTEEGVLRAPFADALKGAVAAREQRRAAWQSDPLPARRSAAAARI
jgi:methylthioribose-1-phosphate isomerase